MLAPRGRRSRARLGVTFWLALTVTPARGGAEAPFVPGNAIGPFQVSPPVFEGQRVSGTALVGYRSGDGQTTGALATVYPAGPSFLRLGVEITPVSPSSSTRFLWGFGLESPRDGTFFANVHDWGPVRPGDGFTMRQAEVSAGYKLPRRCAGSLCAASSAFAALPFEGGPYVGGGLTLIVARTWFASAALGWTIPGALPVRGDPRAWRLFYSLGRWDGRPGGLFVTYHDELRMVSLRDAGSGWRQGNGVVAAGVNWAY